MNKNAGSNDGFVLIVAMLLLLILTVVGVMATRTAIIELQIAGNERRYTKEFYIADSVWQYGGLWLEAKDNAPSLVNTTNASTGNADRYVRNYGSIKNASNQNIPEATPDGGFPDPVYPNDPNKETLYWYRVAQIDHKKVSGEGANYRCFIYDIDAVAGNTILTTRVTKVYKIGY